MNKKRFLCLILAAATAIGCAAPAAALDSASLSVVRSLGIVQSNEYGAMSLSSTATRGEFARMLIAAGNRLDSVSATSSTSPFQDVKYNSSNAGYIKTVSAEGLMTGYMDGTFRPDSGIKLEEAASAVLRLLGYTDSGTPDFLLDKARSLGLLSGINRGQGETLNIEDCATMFSNALSAKTAAGSTYASSIGIADTAGDVDYTAAVASGLQGPILCETGVYSAVPFSLSGADIYLNGSRADASAIDKNDVVYYNASMKTVWAYRKRVTGVYTAATPSTSSPTSVTVAGQSYSVTGSAAYSLSDLGGISVGDTVTLLLDRSGNAAFALQGSVTTAAMSQAETVGVVTGVSASSYTDSYGKDNFSYTASVICADGVLRTYPVSTEKSFKEGDVVKITGSGSSPTLTKQSKVSLKGTVSAGGSVGGYTIASDAQILDYLNSGSYGTVYRSNLNGITLSSSNVLYYALNTNGEISTLILKNATGDVGTYGFVTKVTAITTTVPGTGEGGEGGEGGTGEDTEPEEIVTGYTVTYLLNGQTQVATLGAEASVSRGGVSFKFKNGQLSSMTPLKKATANRISGLKAVLQSGTATIDDGVSVYVKMGSDYYQSSLATVQDTSAYSLTCYYDQNISSGKVRVIVAEAK